MNTQHNPQWHINLEQQRTELIARHPGINAFFVPIYEEKLGVTLWFLPLRAFRLFNLFSSEKKPFRTFRSSGSTQSMRATHTFTRDAFDVYSKDACLGFETFLQRFKIPINIPILNLIPQNSFWPESSLSEMMGMIAANPKFDVTNVNIEGSPESFFKEYSKPKFSSCLIFGTSFHHVVLGDSAQKIDFHTPHNKGTIIAVDTGGTKGRTQTFTPSEIRKIAENSYGPCNSFMFLSEFGMCELASQAYSACVPHNGAFQCNASLSAFSVNLKDLSFNSENETGFLAFLDKNNLDSYGAVLTEDLGYTLPNSSVCHLDKNTPGCEEFVLEKRAPDASIKGCSLNVRQNFFFKTRPAFKPKMYALNAEQLISKLSPQYWDSFSQADLRMSLLSWTETHPPILTKAQTEALARNPIESISIVASANIPISWLHTAGVAAYLGTKEINIYLPSLRTDDPYSERIRFQIHDLANALFLELTNNTLPSLPPLKIEVHDKTMPQKNHNSSRIVVFGSNETLATFRSEYATKNVEIVGLGDVRNSITIKSPDSECLKAAAKACALWGGRGCLNPVAVFFPKIQSSQPAVDEFFSLLKSEFFQRSQAAGISHEFFHQHAQLEVCWRFARAGSAPAFMAGPGTLVVNALNLSAEQIIAADFDLTAAGMGYVALIPEELRHLQCFSNLQQFPVTPNLWEHHNGRTWIDWLLGTSSV